MPHSLTEFKQSPSKRPRIMNTPPAEADEMYEEASSLPGRPGKTQADSVLGKERALIESWERLLHHLRQEVDAVAQAGSDIVPVIDFQDLR